MTNELSEIGMSGPIPGTAGKKKGFLYLHGFLSSPASAKCRELAEAARAAGFAFVAPDLNLSPAKAADLAEAQVRAMESEGLEVTGVGSSLGGFYAGRLARRFGLRAVLLNPCLNPWAIVSRETGLRTIYGTDRTLLVEERFADELLALAEETPPVPADLTRTLAVISTADEVLDWKDAYGKLKGAEILLSEGDNHRLERFADFIPAILSVATEG